MWFTLFLFIASTVLSELLRPKPNVVNAKPAGLGSFNFPTATEGRAVPLIWGTVLLDGPNVVWYGDLTQVPIIVTQKTGLFSSTDQVVGYKYFVGVQFGLCRGVVDSLNHIWVGDDLVYSAAPVTDGNVAAINLPGLFGGDTLGQGGLVANVRFFAGTETQAVSDYLASSTGANAVPHTVGTGTSYSVNDILTVVGGSFSVAMTIRVTTVNGGGGILTAIVENAGHYTVQPTNPVSVTGGSGTGAQFDLSFNDPLQLFPGGVPPAYRGTCYALLEHVGTVPASGIYPAGLSGYIGNSTSIKPWKFELKRIVTGPVSFSFQAPNAGADCNPANVIYEVMTNTDWGLGISPSTIDSASFAAAGQTLWNEGNGFSMVLDQVMQARDFLNLIQQQIDGLVFQNQITGLWTLQLARGGYTVGSLFQVTDANIREVKAFTRGAWTDTTNQVRVEFNSRRDTYKLTYAPAHDMANVRIQGGQTVQVTDRYPGVKDGALANAIAWRDLRALSYPLAHAQLLVDRSAYAVQPVDVVAVTIAERGVTQLPMRVTRVDHGDLTDGTMTLDLVEDVFVNRTGEYVDPPDSGWSPPTSGLKPFFTTDQLVFEAPRGFTVRDAGTPTDRIWCSGRKAQNNGNAVGFLVRERHSAGATSGPYATAGEGFRFMLIGTLQANLAEGTAVPTSSIVILSNPDAQAALIAGVTPAGSPTDLGTNLTNLILVDDEFMLVTSAQTTGANVELDGVYRGALDTVQAAHSVGAFVYLLSAGGALTDTVFTPGNNVDIKLLPESATSQVAEASATTVSLTMSNRLRKPYPPSSVDIGGTTFANTVSLEQTGAAPETYGFTVHLLRRDFRTLNEVASLGADAGTLAADFPAANSTTHQIDVRKTDNTLLFTLTTGTQDTTVLREHVLRYLDGVLPANLRLRMRALHLVDGTSYTSRVDLVWDFATTTALTGQFNFGARAAGITSNLYTATQAGTYNFTLSTAFTTGNVEYRVNGGAWTTLILAGATTGAILGILVSDTIEVRHLSTDAGAEKFLAMAAPGGGTNAYFVPFV